MMSHPRYTPQEIQAQMDIICRHLADVGSAQFSEIAGHTGITTKQLKNRMNTLRERSLSENER